MLNSKKWERAVISDIALALHVPATSRRSVHTNRPYHGLVLNEIGSERDYYFSDGTVLHTKGQQLFYLPRGSTYKIANSKAITKNTCYAINFSADLSDKPFVVSFRNPEPVEKLFKNAILVWKRQDAFCDVIIRKTLYEIILAASKEQQKKYTTVSTNALIAPALDMIRSEFTRNDISVSELAKLCNISEAYLRKIFLNKYGVSPKEYIINMRMTYAKQLLALGEFPVGTVAVMCGYAEPAHFSREFTRRVGVAPSNFNDEKISGT